MKQPLGMIAALYVAGILFGSWFELDWRFLFFAALLTAVLALASARMGAVFLAALLFLSGAMNLTLHTVILSPHDLRLKAGEKAELVSVRGILSETPAPRETERDEQLVRKTIGRIEVREIYRETRWEPAAGKVLVTTPGSLDAIFFTGQPVEIQGILRPPPERLAEGLFDYRTHLRQQGIYYQLLVESPADWRLLNSPDSARSPPWSHRFQTWARHNLSRGLPEEDEAVRLLWAMTLGWRTGLSGEVSLPFMQSGTLHIFAISGLHITLIAGILVSVLRVLQIPQAASGLIAVPALWFYAAATGWQPSAVRSTLMMSLVIGGWALKRPGQLLNSLAAAALILLFWEPLQLFQAGFQLSFLVVLSIGLLLPMLEKARARLLEPDPFLPQELRPRWQRWLDPPLQYLTHGAATSLAAWLGSVPLIALYFHLFTPINLLANLIVIPLSALALMSSMGSLFCGAWQPFLTECFNHGAWFWMRGMMRASEWTAALPGAYFHVRHPSWAFILAYYAFLAVLFSGIIFAKSRRRWAIPAWMAGVAAGLALWTHEQHSLRLSILPLGGGGWFVDAPKAWDDLLIDSGDRSSAEFVVRPFLQAQGVKKLSYLMLTHGDVQHVGGADYLRDQFFSPTLLTSSVRFRSSYYRQIMAELEEQPQLWRQVHRGDSNGSWKVLHPDREEKFALADDAAIVLQGCFEDLTLLLLSDLGRAGQRTLLAREPGLRADILITGLPADREPAGDFLLRQVQPRVIIVASSRSPHSARAPLKLRARLLRWGIPVFYTEETGAVTLEFARGRCQIRSQRGDRLEINRSSNPAAARSEDSGRELPWQLARFESERLVSGRGTFRLTMKTKAGSPAVSKSNTRSPQRPRRAGTARGPWPFGPDARFTACQPRAIRV